MDFLLDEVSQKTDWSQISPTVFGAVFESTLNPETRRKGGMHYTSPENIHKVIGPLFLDDLKGELESILTDGSLGQRARHNRLRTFHDKIAGLTFFDPSCGSGNFLTETYIQLRKLENKILSELQHHQGVLAFTEEFSPLKISLRQFHGIEINDFAVNVASTALWIAELQANAEAQSIVYSLIKDLPLQDSAHIVHGNALETDWNEIVPSDQVDYIIGNPPFVGSSNLDDKQKAERLRIMGKSGGVLDYVACWFKKAAQYIRGTTTEAALVATNSITQGQQVQPLWKPLFDDGLVINFAHRSFSWASESKNAAKVHVVIIGFSYQQWATKTLFTYTNEGIEVEHPENINAYLAPAPNVFNESRPKPLNAPIPMFRGNQPTDGGNLLMNRVERDELIAKEPSAKKWIRRYSMGEEFIEGKERFCLWLVDIHPSELKNMPLVEERVEQVREKRLMSPKDQTRKKAAKPWLFDEIRYKGGGTYIGVPSVSSERRHYIPMGFVTDGMIPGNKLYFVPTDSRYVFGILMSRVHNAWMRAVGGRLEMRYNYANTIIYNTFVWPEIDDIQRTQIEATAQAVLDARAQYPDATLEDLYDPDDAWMYPALMKAHAKLDMAVERAYGLDPGLEEKDIVTHLFELYNEAIQNSA